MSHGPPGQAASSNPEAPGDIQPVKRHPQPVVERRRCRLLGVVARQDDVDAARPDGQEEERGRPASDVAPTRGQQQHATATRSARNPLMLNRKRPGSHPTMEMQQDRQRAHPVPIVRFLDVVRSLPQRARHIQMAFVIGTGCRTHRGPRQDTKRNQNDTYHAGECSHAARLVTSHDRGGFVINRQNQSPIALPAQPAMQCWLIQRCKTVMAQPAQI